ncbi:DNA-binding protein [Citrobacter braakii]|uniref:DNA-binding protein n=1 Tax=Citrobacter braakii TaxID=57706 RepID=UPI0037C52F89
MPNCIPLDPKLPANFDNTRNEDRSKAQLDVWWDHPYGITQSDGRIFVRCLNGGAWDRSSFLGEANTYEEACLLAEAKQARWVATRAQPIFQFSIEPPFVLIRHPQRPDHEATLVGEFDTMEEMNEFSKAYDRGDATSPLE